MAGRKQHYIPQLLLRKFGEKVGRATHVVVYPESRDPHPVSTRDIAAQRYFYSKESKAGDPKSLDDEITDYETTVDRILEDIESKPNKAPIKSIDAANIVTHLCVRNRMVRDAFEHGASSLIGAIDASARDVNDFHKLLGNDRIRDEIESALVDHAEILAARGISQTQSRVILHDQLNNNLGGLLESLRPQFDSFLQQILDNAGKFTKEAHNTTLANEIAPEQRVRKYSKLSWRILENTDANYILPDCVVVSRLTDASFRPLVFTPLDVDLRSIVMPLSPTKLIVGQDKEEDFDGTGSLNNAFAECSWSFFIAKQKEEGLNVLRSRIGAISKKFVNASVLEAIEEIKD